MRYWLHITAGRGPAECCWVVEKLVCHILELAQKDNFSGELLDCMDGEKAATLRSALLAFEGDERLASFVESWHGTVQWIGKSMFRSRHKRNNWYVSVAALEPFEPKKVERLDVRVETMRSSGPGGQHVNSTDSAVRVTERTSGLSVVSKEERSQYLNRKLAMARLQKLLEEKDMQEKKNVASEHWQHHNEIERGNARRVFTGSSFKQKK